MKKAIILLLLVALSCSPVIRVYTDHDHDYSIREYTTFNWADQREIEAVNNPLYYNELNDKRIKNAVNDELKNKGYILTTDNPSLILHYHIIVENRSTISAEPCGYYYGPFWMRTRAHVYQYREGSLIIDLMDAKKNNLIWRGWAVSVLESVYEPKKIDMVIKSAVAKIFKDFPKAAEHKAIVIYKP